MSSSTTNIEKERMDIVLAELNTVKEQLANPKGLSDIERERLLERLRMLYFFIELLQWKDQPKVPMKDKRTVRPSQDRELYDKMFPPTNPNSNPNGGNPFLPRRRRTLLDDQPRNDGPLYDWRYDPFETRKKRCLSQQQTERVADYYWRADHYKQKWDEYTGRLKRAAPDDKDQA